MHDPYVVAFTIRRPWPKREPLHDAKHPRRVKDRPRWKFTLHHSCVTCDEDKRAQHAGRNMFPWWKPGSWTPFWTVAGRGIYWPSLITVWHREPGGRDSGEVCKHITRYQDADGKWQYKVHHAWRWHVHHWRIQVHPLQALRRWALTRCAWCGGRSRKGDYANISHQWDGPRGRWWRGEPGLFHIDCSSIESAHRSCTCDDPLTEHSGYGRCARCNRSRGYGRPAVGVETDRLLAAIPAGQRDPAVYARVKRMWAEHRKEGAAA